MKILDDISEVALRCKQIRSFDRLLEDIYDVVLTAWLSRQPERWPTQSNWKFRVAPSVTFQPDRNHEKQLQKAIVSCAREGEWGNDVPTASGLFNSGNRQMNVDLVTRTREGFTFVELKLKSNDYWEATIQAMRYLAIYMLYRVTPELKQRFLDNSMLTAELIEFEVLAPRSYYPIQLNELALIEMDINEGIYRFCEKYRVDVRTSFHYCAFPPGFSYKPGMDCETIRFAVERRGPFLRRVTHP